MIKGSLGAVGTGRLSREGPLRWKGKRIQELHNRVIRLEVKMHHAELYAFRGRFHFLDAQDQRMIHDGKAIDTSLFDF